MSFSRRLAAVLPLLLPLVPSSAARAQEWNTPGVRGLVERAIERRAATYADSGLRSYRAVAHGFVFFLGQLGEGFREPPRLIKSDQLALVVYWQAPGLSKQIIMGRRDRRDLPTDMQYHRDHLGIVQNNFRDSIRLGEGDEVRDVPHPLAAAGLSLYDYAITDSLTIQLPDRSVRVYAVPVRPRAFDQPRVVGTMYIDTERAELVRFHFNFTPAAYRDNTVEDIVVLLDNAMWFGRYWLPRRQEIEIRRRSSWLDLPARGIIRGRWEIGSYEFNIPIPQNLFLITEPEIIAAPLAVRDTFRWQQPLDDAIREAVGPVQAADLDEVRTTIERAVANRALTGLSRSRPSFGSLSEVLHVNRVEGLAPGFGWVVRPGDRRVEYGAWASYGTADQRLKWRLAASRALGRWTVAVGGGREVRDVGDEPVISPALNSFLAQERGADYGDYVLLRRLEFSARRPLGGRGMLRLEAAVEEAHAVFNAAQPSSGQYRANQVAPSPGIAVGRVALERRRLGVANRADLGLLVALETGGNEDDPWYVRGRGAAEAVFPAGPLEFQLRAGGGVASDRVPAYRSFTLGGRGTLPGESFRAWGGRAFWLAHAEARFRVPFPAIRLGPMGSTGSRAVIAPFIAAGGASGLVPGVPWVPSAGPRVVAGAAIELFHGLLRSEIGTSLHTGRTAIMIDVRKDLWSIL